MCFYHAMLRRARYCYILSSLRPSVTLRYCDHTGWNSSKIIFTSVSRDVRSQQTPTSQIYSKGTPQDFGWNKVQDKYHSAYTHNVRCVYVIVSYLHLLLYSGCKYQSKSQTCCIAWFLCDSTAFLFCDM